MYTALRMEEVTNKSTIINLIAIPLVITSTISKLDTTVCECACVLCGLERYDSGWCVQNVSDQQQAEMHST